jgi:hypothetical protein
MKVMKKGFKALLFLMCGKYLHVGLAALAGSAKLSIICGTQSSRNGGDHYFCRKQWCQ